MQTTSEIFLQLQATIEISVRSTKEIAFHLQITNKISLQLSATNRISLQLWTTYRICIQLNAGNLNISLGCYATNGIFLHRRQPLISHYNCRPVNNEQLWGPEKKIPGKSEVIYKNTWTELGKFI